MEQKNDDHNEIRFCVMCEDECGIIRTEDGVKKYVKGSKSIDNSEVKE